MGLGKSVIQLCKKDTYLHFDIAQKNTIMCGKSIYKTPASGYDKENRFGESDCKQPLIKLYIKRAREVDSRAYCYFENFIMTSSTPSVYLP